MESFILKNPINFCFLGTISVALNQSETTTTTTTTTTTKTTTTTTTTTTTAKSTTFSKSKLECAIYNIVGM